MHGGLGARLSGDAAATPTAQSPPPTMPPPRRRATPDAPDDRRARLNPNRPPPEPNGPIVQAIDAAVDRLGIDPGKRSRSRRDGFRPNARAHVRRYLLREVCGLPIRFLMHEAGLVRSSVYSSLRQGERLCRENAVALGPAFLAVFRPQVALDVEGDDSDDAY